MPSAWPAWQLLHCSVDGAVLPVGFTCRVATLYGTIGALTPPPSWWQVWHRPGPKSLPKVGPPEVIEWFASLPWQAALVQFPFACA